VTTPGKCGIKIQVSHSITGEFFSPLNILKPTCTRHPIQISQVCCNCTYSVLQYQETLHLSTQCLYVLFIWLSQ